MALSKQDLTKEEKRKLKSGQATLDELYQARIESLVIPTAPNVLTTDNKITVLCVRFGNRYGREYVERLRNMVSRHLTVPYEFACLTDDHHPIDGVRTLYQPNAQYPKGWWHKVHMFDPALPIAGRILYFDLDVVIHNNIDNLARMQPTEFLGIHDFNRKFYANWKYLNSSVMAWNHGSHSYIWEQFKTNPRDAQRLQGDQDWIWKLAKDQIKFWPKEWIQSYKWEVRSKEELTMMNGKRQFKSVDHTVELHPQCCVTVFHGDPKPQDVKDQFVVDNWK